MSLLAAALLLSAKTAAAAPATTPPVSVRVSSAVVDWLRVYPLAQYRETWTVDAQVRDLDKDLPRVMAAVEKQGGRLAVPLQNSVASTSEGSRQLVYQLDEKQAKAALKALKKVARCSAPLVRPVGEKLPLDEIKSKMDALARDKESHGAALAEMPAVSALVDAVLANLGAARSVAGTMKTEVTLDLSLTTKGK